MAELSETPIMLVVIMPAARWVSRRFALPSTPAIRLGVGGMELMRKPALNPTRSSLRLFSGYFRCVRMGAKEIGKTLNSKGLRTNKGRLWNKNNVYYVLKNEVYKGTLVWNRQHKSQGRPRSKEPKDIIRIENNHPAVISREMFEKVQALLRERSPEITHPRTITSDYLLSGFLYCGKCGSGMLGCAAKSSRFFYYACHNYCKRGKDVCKAKLIKKERIEGFVVDRIKVNLLTEDNLRELLTRT